MLQAHQTNLYKIGSQYDRASYLKGLSELGATFAIYAVSLISMYVAYHHSWLLALLFAIPNGLSIVRLFIIQHDCSHGSFFSNPRANIYLGRVLSVFTWLPFFAWKWQHLIHHGTSGNIEKRGIGDVTLLTVEEYQNLSKLKKLAYRIKNHSLLYFFVLAPIYFTLIFRAIHRLYLSYRRHPRFTKKIGRSVHLTNMGLLLFYLLYIYFFGIKFILTVYSISIFIAIAFGAWLFYVQHIFPDTYFAPEKEWNYVDAALKGSSFYKQSELLRWFTLNIGFHHIHHLFPKIPSYNLKRCFDENILLQNAKTFTLKDAVLLAKLKLFDMKNQRAITWKEYKRLT